MAHESCKSVVYGKDAYSISHRRSELEAMGVSDFKLDFLTRPYDQSQMALVIDAAIAGAPVENSHEANYSRTLL